MTKADVERVFKAKTSEEEGIDFYLFVECVEELLERAWGTTSGSKPRKNLANQAAEIDENGDLKPSNAFSKWQNSNSASFD